MKKGIVLTNTISVIYMKAPLFSLPDQDGKTRSLSEYRGSWVLLYFYPKDDTPGCTKEACSFRDAQSIYKEKGIQVIGVSKDSVASHRKFADKYHLAFPLLSDETKTALTAYNAWGEKKFLGKTITGTLRKSFLIGPDGEIRKEYSKVNVLSHAEEILRDFESLRS